MPNWLEMREQIQGGGSYGSGGGGRKPPRYRNRNEHLEYELEQFRPEAHRRGERATRLQQEGDAALRDPSASIGLFKDLYSDFAQATLAPVQRQFADTVSSNLASTASRFGGSASSEEVAGVNQASDIFSRNAAEAVTRTGVAAGQAGMQHATALAQHGTQAQAQQDRILQMILAAIGGMEEDEEGGFMDTLGTIGGAAAGLVF